MRILIVEDEKRLADTLRDLLIGNKYMADAVYDGERGLDEAMSGIYDAVVLDVMLPKLNGFEIVRKLREASVSVPVLMLTARTDVDDKIRGLDCGADYYLTKPFDTAEFLACLRSILRRQGEIVPEVISFGDLGLNVSTCSLECGGKNIRLSSKEFEIMHILIQNGERIVSKETLLLKAWGFDSRAEDNHVEVYISFLRKKLMHIGSSVEIGTIRRVGYHLVQKRNDS